MLQATPYQIKVFPVTPGFRLQALEWASTYQYCSYFTSNGISYPNGAFHELLAVGNEKVWKLGDAPFEDLFYLQEQHQDWLIGYFTYELKNNIHALNSSKPLSVAFPPCTFYLPDSLLLFKEACVEIKSRKQSPEEVFEQIMASSPPVSKTLNSIKLHPHMSRQEYLLKVEQIREHILNGDCYELNLCQEFSADNAVLNPLSLFLQLNSLSPAPFASFQKLENQFLICASPERFLKKEGSKLISQPIKGTIRRGITTEEDESLKQQLRTDEKEMAENMMIVDLVRNDLAISSLPGSVKVDELFGIYSFRHVHQMISTVSSTLRPGMAFTDTIRNAFPMGSMTGAPKKKVMELIEQYENSSRGLYSGAVGYVSPEGDFDFNVVIRSLVYDSIRQKLSFQVGGAITYDSNPEKEYDECLLKAKALMQVLGVVGVVGD